MQIRILFKVQATLISTPATNQHLRLTTATRVTVTVALITETAFTIVHTHRSRIPTHPAYMDIRVCMAIIHTAVFTVRTLCIVRTLCTALTQVA